MVKSHANTSVFRFTANSPRTQVSPSRGRRMTDAFTVVLEEEKVCMLSTGDVNITVSIMYFDSTVITYTTRSMRFPF